MAASLGLHVLVLWTYVMTVTGLQHSSRCHGSDPVSLDIRCDAGYMLQIVRVLHGYNTRHDCTYRPGDCKKEQRQRYDCVGTQRCVLNETREAVWIPRCKQNSNFVQVDYNCIRATLVHNICDNTSTPLTDQQGFIASPNYPNSYPPSVKCDFKVQVDEGQRLEFHVIDIDLRDSRYYDCLMMNDHISSHTWCNAFANEQVFQSRSNQVSITFSTNDQQQSKGFWIYYKATPPRQGSNQKTELSVQTTTAQQTTGGTVRPVTQTTLQTTATSQTVKDRKSVTQPEIKNEKKNESNGTQTRQHGPNEKSDMLPIGAIIGAVLGTLVLIMAALIALLVVRKMREKRRKRSDSLHMIFT